MQAGKGTKKVQLVAIGALDLVKKVMKACMLTKSLETPKCIKCVT